ncbi:MAG: efflux RND transporter permease subunit, partial [Actinomycetota bacterium]|nr:efflux RND transporter permease subunit [Actinomycetota bacterium]
VVEAAEVRNLLTESIDPATGEQALRQTRFTRVVFGGDDSFRDAVGVGLIRAEDAGLDVLEFSDAVNDALDRAELADGFHAAVTADFANDIRSQLSLLLRNLLTGLIAVAVVSYLLIGWRVSLITAAFMATVMLTALLSLWLVGYSLNTITMFGLILTLGLLVDDAIVVSESVDATRDDPGERGTLGVIRRAIDRVGSASWAGTLTTVLVFAPMLFVSGILGRFIRAIPATVIITLLLSFALSMTVIPALGRKFLLSSAGGRSPLMKAERTTARGLGRLAAYPSRNGAKGWSVGAGMVLVSIVVLVASALIASTVGFNIFPEAKDTNVMLVGVDFDNGVTTAEAEAATHSIDDTIIEVLGDDLVRAQYIFGNERGVSIFIDLVSFADRDTKSPVYVKRLEEAIVTPDRARVTVDVVGQAPPTEDFPFAVQIAVDADSVGAGEQLARDIQEAIHGAALDKSSGDAATISDTLVSTEGRVFRTDGHRLLEVRAAFDTDDTTNNLNAAEDLVGGLFPAQDLEARGLSGDALDFDFGFASDNQDDFNSLFLALMIAMAAMFILLVVQFRSVMQPVLILLAIPFSFLGVVSILALTDNAFSFFVMVGLIALIGVVVNNTILLVDAANQGRRAGMTSKEAIGSAIEHRFRPLLATTLTTVAGLLPLALSDPFW